MTTTTFRLHDSTTGQSLDVRVEQRGVFLNLHPDGYGNPVSLDFFAGKLSVLLNDDPSCEEPRVIPLTAVSEK